MPTTNAPSAQLRFGSKNYVLLGSAIAVLVAGYVLLGLGSVQAAPVLLVIGYCVLFPLGLLLGTGDAQGE